MEWPLVGIILTNFLTLGASNLAACIRIVALQGILLSLLPILERGSLSDFHTLSLFFITVSIKALAIPFLLTRSLHQARIKKEVEPMVSLHFSLLTGGAIVVLSFFVSNILDLETPFSSIIIPVALSTVLTGFFLLISRTKAITQVIGFLILDNGVFLFGTTLISDFPLTVEMGILLDLWVGVFVMGIMIHHINRTFNHIDTRVLSTLKDTE